MAAIAPQPNAAPPVPGSTTAPAQRNLVGRWADFWLLGGASIAFCLLFMIAAPLRSLVPSFEGSLLRIGAAGLLLSFFVNFPHFMASYRLAYSREKEFREQHRFELKVVPIVLSAVALVGVIVARTFDEVGGLSRTSILTGLGTLMFLSVGWHYVKQIYGCVRVCASFDGYSMDNRQMSIIRYGLFPMWLRSLMIVNDQASSLAGLGYGWEGGPSWMVMLTNIAVAIGALAIIAVFVQNWLESGQVPTLRMVVPIVAIYVWWVPAVRFGFPLPLVPLFHSLQYVPFIVKVERSKAEDALAAAANGANVSAAAVRTRMVLVAIGLVVTGGLVMYGLPVTLDAVIGTHARTGLYIMLIAVTLVINVHHYFIDHVIWRLRDDAYTRDLLMR